MPRPPKLQSAGTAQPLEVESKENEKPHTAAQAPTVSQVLLHFFFHVTYLFARLAA